MAVMVYISNFGFGASTISPPHHWMSVRASASSNSTGTFGSTTRISSNPSAHGNRSDPRPWYSRRGLNAAPGTWSVVFMRHQTFVMVLGDAWPLTVRSGLIGGISFISFIPKCCGEVIAYGIRSPPIQKPFAAVWYFVAPA